MDLVLLLKVQTASRHLSLYCRAEVVVGINSGFWLRGLVPAAWTAPFQDEGPIATTEGWLCLHGEAQSAAPSSFFSVCWISHAGEHFVFGPRTHRVFPA